MPRRIPNALALHRAKVPKLTQAKVARALKTDVPRVSQLEAGFMVPTRDELRTLCSLFGTRESALYADPWLTAIRDGGD